MMPEPELLREFLGDPAGRIKCPTVAQEMLFGAKGRVFQLQVSTSRATSDDFAPGDLTKAQGLPRPRTQTQSRHDGEGALIEQTLALDPGRTARPMAPAVDQRP